MPSRRARPRAPSGADRAGRAAVAGLRLVRPVRELRAARRRVPRSRLVPRLRGPPHDRPCRAPTARSSASWWWTVDRMHAGAVSACWPWSASSWSSPPARRSAERVYGAGMHFVVKHFVFLRAGGGAAAGRRLDAGAIGRAARWPSAMLRPVRRSAGSPCSSRAEIKGAQPLAAILRACRCSRSEFVKPALAVGHAA